MVGLRAAVDTKTVCRRLRRMTEWARRIQRMEASGWTLTELANQLGVAVSTLSDIKNGRTIEPKGMAAVRLFQLDEHLHGALPDQVAPDSQAA